MAFLTEMLTSIYRDVNKMFISFIKLIIVRCFQVGLGSTLFLVKLRSVNESMYKRSENLGS